MIHHDAAVSEPVVREGRIHGLDWLRVLLVFGVFLFHALHPFDAIPWVVKNDQTSFALTGILMLFFPWGLPVLFLVAGASAHLAGARRSFRQFARERTQRLLVPFLVGTALLAPVQAWLVATHQGTTDVGFWAYVPTWAAGLPWLLSPAMFSQWGWHLWFLGFLFSFALLAWPLQGWLRTRGASLVAGAARLVEARRGSILLGVLPLIVVREVLHPLAPLEHGWTDFTYYFLFYVYGLVLLQDRRFLDVIRRDWWAGLGLALVGVMAIGGGTGAGLIDDAAWEPITGATTGSVVLNLAMPMAAFGAGMVVVAVAISRLTMTNALLRYGRDALVPFYVIHQPVVIAVAVVVVSWDAGLWVKVAATLVGSLALTLLLVEVVRRVPGLGRLFGVKPAASVRSAMADREPVSAP